MIKAKMIITLNLESEHNENGTMIDIDLRPMMVMISTTMMIRTMIIKDNNDGAGCGNPVQYFLSVF